MLTPKEIGGGKRHLIPYAGIVTAVSSAQSLPTQASASLWYLDAGELIYGHVHISKNDTTVTVTIGGTTAYNYTGTIGTTYADLIKNVLTEYFGEWASAWAEVHCCDQLLGVDVFSAATSGTFNVTILDETVSAFIGGTPTGTPSGYGAANHGIKALDNNFSTFWDTGPGVTTGWIKYDFGTGNKKAIASYGMRPDSGYAGGSYTPSGWIIAGSDDDISWTTLGTVTGNAAWSTFTTKMYTLSNTTEYRYYRLNITGCVSASETLLADWLGYALVTTTYDKRRPIKPKGITYGAAGVGLDFAASANLGNDISGNGNDWTITGTQTTTTPTS